MRNIMRHIALTLAVALCASAASPQSTPPPSPSRGREWRPAVFIGAGAAAGGLLLAGGGWAAREWAVGVWNSDACWPAGSTRYASCPGAAAAARSSELLAITGLALAGAGAAVAAVALAVGGFHSLGPVRVSAGPSPFGAGMEVTF